MHKRSAEAWSDPQQDTSSWAGKGGPRKIPRIVPGKKSWYEPHPSITLGPAPSTLLPSSNMLEVDEAFADEVQRIISVGASDYRAVLELEPNEFWDLQAIQSRYRQIMRILHPDKRKAEDVAYAGGEELCNQAVELVQEALAHAKRHVTPAGAAHDRARRLQELTCTQARHAMQRAEREAEEAGQRRKAQADSLLDKVERELMVKSIKNVLTSGSASTGAAPPEDSSNLLNKVERELMVKNIKSVLTGSQSPVCQSAPPKPSEPPPTATAAIDVDAVEVVDLDSDTEPAPPPSQPQQPSKTTSQIMELLRQQQSPDVGPKTSNTTAQICDLIARLGNQGQS